jgi:hypothetical protein
MIESPYGVFNARALSWTSSLLLVLLLALVLTAEANARPVSYVGGWTIIETSNRQSTAALVHYTATPKLSVGGRAEWDRNADFMMAVVQPTWLAKRWFGRDFQANVYLTGGLGLAKGINSNPMGSDTAYFAGVMADWETRRHFLSYETRYLDAGHFGDNFMQAARVGWAPYEGDTGDLHTWLMVEVDHRPDARESVGVTPLIRFFKNALLVEIGYNITEHQPLANFTLRL